MIHTRNTLPRKDQARVPAIQATTADTNTIPDQVKSDKLATIGRLDSPVFASVLLAQLVAPPTQQGPIRLPGAGSQEQRPSLTPTAPPLQVQPEGLPVPTPPEQPAAPSQPVSPQSPERAYPVQGNVPYSRERLTTLLQGCTELEACAERLRRQLAKDGYLNSQVVSSESPPSLQVRLGRLEALNITGPSGWVNRRVQRLLGDLVDQPLRLHALERQLRLLQFQPGMRIEAASLTSIANDPFRAQLTLKMVPAAQPVRGDFSLRNDGTSGSGEYRATGVLLKNALALPGDTLLLFGEVDGTDTPELGTVIGSLSYTLPLTDSVGLTGSFGYNRRTQVELPSPDDLFTNEQYQGQVQLEWTLVERMLQRWSVSASLTRSENVNTYDGKSLSSFFPSLYANPRSGYLRIALNGSGLSGPLAWNGNTYFLQGVGAMTPEDQRQDLARFGVEAGQASAIGTLVSASWAFAPTWQLQLRGGGQVAFHPLTSPMQFTLGSDVGIRGLPSQLVSGNSGWLATGELEWTFWRKGNQALQLVPFLGAGGVYFTTLNNASASDTVGSGGALIRWLQGNNLSVELGYVSTFNDANTPGQWNDWLLGKGLYAQIGYRF